MKALIISVKAGYGHHSTGQALIDYLEQKGFTCTMLDTFEYINPILGDSISDGYLFSTKYLPEAYGKVYGMFSKREEHYDKYSLVSVLSKIVSHKLKDFITAFGPDVVIGTHSYACMLMTFMKEKGHIQCPTYGICTDFTVHPFWESTDIDYYVTPDALLNNQMNRKGIPTEKILPFGIPIKQQFAQKMPKQEARAQLGIEDKMTILVMMGSMGFGNLEKQMESIDQLKGDFQVLCVCGNNAKGKKQIDKHQWQKNIITYGFINNVDVLMDASDLIITKPGGLTTSEFLAKRLPAIIMNPIPGQEDRNMEFLVNSGAAVMVTDTFPVDEALYELLNNEWRMELLQKSVEKLGKPHSTEHLCEFIIEELNKLHAEKEKEVYYI